MDLPEFEGTSKSLQTAWVQRMKKGVENQWMAIPSFYLKNVGGPFIFYCDYDVKFLDLNNILKCIFLIIISFLARDISSWKGSNLNPQVLITFLNLLKTS